MAFTSESSRMFGIEQNSGSGEVGPGSYLAEDSYIKKTYNTKKDQYPPFGQGSERKYSTSINQKGDIPGPGSYDYNNNIVNTVYQKEYDERSHYIIQDNGHINRRTQMYANINTRYKHNKTENILGPGYYDVDGSSFQQKQINKQKLSNNRRQFNVTYNTSVPSIPSKFNIQEYEEEQAEQQNNQQQSTGRNRYKRLSDDKIRLGPGSYDAKHTFVKKSSRAVSWANKQAQRCDFSKYSTTTDSLGPGTYNINSNQDRKIPIQTFPKEISQRTVQKIILKKQANRGTIKPDFEVDSQSSDQEDGRNQFPPGPGQYLNETHVSTLANVTHRRNQYQQQNFGNSIERFSNINESKISNLGPGQYNIDIDEKKRKRNKTLQKAGSSSFANSQRVKEQGNVNNIDQPGPGQYDAQQFSTKGQGQKSIFFSSKIDRFKNKEDHMPGPEKYNLPSSFRIQNLSQLHNSSFKSQTKRELQFQIDKDVPGAAIYNSSQYQAFGSDQLQGGAPNNFLLLTKKKVNGSQEIASNSSRLRQESTLSQTMNQPQKTYDKRILEKYDGLLNKTVKFTKQKQTGMDKRFKEFNSTTTPGPGTYNDLNKWHKKTFNLKFLNVQLPPYTSSSPSAQ